MTWGMADWGTHCPVVIVLWSLKLTFDLSLQRPQHLNCGMAGAHRHLLKEEAEVTSRRQLSKARWPLAAALSLVLPATLRFGLLLSSNPHEPPPVLSEVSSSMGFLPRPHGCALRLPWEVGAAWHTLGWGPALCLLLPFLLHWH